ncbi:indole-3-glycerol-phosphate synthase [Methanolobus sp. ZRKC3]|uniref:indole-3-glycerol-phosphate synthase n=1 Tax=Methanolobus sp. ZRKC3 TaxID=3125786 RepID=UPI003246359B
MHSVIKDIVKATEKRVENIQCKEGKAIDSDLIKRDIIAAIKEKQSKGKVPVISEVKPASPRGKLMDISPVDAANIARKMEDAGAVAISVLTEPDFFNGSTHNLAEVRKNVEIPVLRKDFIINKIQMREIESDLILLIVSILGKSTADMVRQAIENGFEPLVEVHNEEELYIALDTNAKMIGINNRDLSTLDVNLDMTVKLAPIIREFDKNNGAEHIIISESGIHDVTDVKRVIDAGADGILVGTSIIKSNDIYKKTKELVEALN